MFYFAPQHEEFDVDVFLNDEPVGSCHIADDMQGFVQVYQFDDNGEEIRERGIRVVETRIGRVDIHCSLETRERIEDINNPYRHSANHILVEKP